MPFLPARAPNAHPPAAHFRSRCGSPAAVEPVAGAAPEPAEEDAAPKPAGPVEEAEASAERVEREGPE